MRGNALPFLAVPLFVFSCGCTAQNEAAPGDTATPGSVATDAGPPDWQPEFDEMVAVLGLTPLEQEPVKAAFQQQEAEVGGWLQGEEGQTLKQQEQELEAAAKAKDLQRVRAITSQAQGRRGELRGMAKASEERILTSLSPEKRVAWEGHLVAKEMLQLMQPLTLTFEQQTAIQNNAAAAVDAARRAAQPNALAAGFLQLEQWVEQSVLTPPQAASYQEIKRRNPMRTLKWGS